MTSEDIITLLFVAVDDTLPELKQPSHAKLHPSELVTIGSLMARKGTSFSAFYRGLKRDDRALFGLPERSRWPRLLKTQQAGAAHLLSAPSFLTVSDSYPTELIFPMREGRSDKQVGKKSKDKGRSLCWCQTLLAP